MRSEIDAIIQKYTNVKRDMSGICVLKIVHVGSSEVELDANLSCSPKRPNNGKPKRILITVSPS
jgi:septum formation topological specificity factor MinE